MIVSAAAHSLLGWKELKGVLGATQVPAELIQTLGLGWNFGGVAMLAFGCIVVAVFAQRLRGQTVSAMPAHVIGATYVAYGVGALLVTRFDPFFLIFVVPGVMLLIAPISRRAA
jgi:hypothetical protein